VQVLLGEHDIALAGLDWLAEFGVPANVIEAARSELLNGTASAQADAGAPALPGGPPPGGDAQAQSGGPPPGDDAQAKDAHLEASPDSLSLAPEESALISIMRVHPNGARDYITSDVTWSSSSSAVAVDARGLATAGKIDGGPVQAIVTATDRATKLQCRITVWVNAAAPLQLSIVPAAFDLAPDGSHQLKAMRAYVGGRTEDVTAKVAWSSSAALVSVDTNGLATAAGVGGDPQSVEITATDRDTNLTATAQVTVQPPEATIVVVPPFSELAPGGSVQLKAQRVQTGGASEDITAEVLWSSSSATVAIDKNGLARADPKAAASEMVDIVVDDIKTNRRTTVSVAVKVPSHETRTFKTPFGEIAYFAGYADQAKPRLEHASKAFLMAEPADTAVEEAYQRMTKIKEQHAQAFANVVKDVRANDGPVKTDANAAQSEEISKKEVTALMGVVTQLTGDLRAEVTSAQAHLQNKQDTKQLRALQKQAQAYNDSIDILAAAANSVVAIVTENPASLVSAAISDIALILKQTNSLAADAAALQDKIDDAELAAAQADLARVQASAASWKAQHESLLDVVQERVQHAANHWTAVEKKYDTDKGNKGGFRFAMVKQVQDAANAVIAAAHKSATSAALAQLMAETLLNDSPTPSQWLAHPDKDWQALNALLTGANQAADVATEREVAAEQMLREMADVLAQARSVMGEADSPDEP
jgi:hypothetical protein